MSKISFRHLKLHESTAIDRHWEVMRVKGGWIYWRPTSDGDAVFVPYANSLGGVL